MPDAIAPDDVWLVYDGGCPLCTYAAQNIAIRQSVGHLHILDARSDPKHPVLREINGRTLDLDEGMVFIVGRRFYHGRDALHMMGLLGSSRGWLNKITAALFRNHSTARIAYPFFRFLRNFLLRIRGVEGIHNLQDQPIFKSVFGEQWDQLPQVIKLHYALRPGKGDSVTVEGHLNVQVKPWLRFLNRLSGLLISDSGENIPVSVRFSSPMGSKDFYFERIFHFPRKTQHFKSRMHIIDGSTLAEIMRFGFAWKLNYRWQDNKVILTHKGYAFHLFGAFIPLPLSLILGKGYAEEWAVEDNEFAMMTYAYHPCFGRTFGYEGRFKITDISCPDPS